MGKGSLVCSIITNDMKIAEEFVISHEYNGRVLVLNDV